MPRKKTATNPSSLKTSEIAKLVKFYNENIRRHDKREMVGIFRQVLLMVKKGITPAQIAQAMRVYAKDPWASGQPEYKRHHIRRFMMPERIRQYAATPPGDPAIERIAVMTETLLDGDAPPPLIPISVHAPDVSEPEPDTL